MRQVIIYRGEHHEWEAICPSLPGCTGSGRTKLEALANIKETINLYLHSLKSSRAPIPEDPFEAIIVAIDPNF